MLFSTSLQAMSMNIVDPGMTLANGRRTSTCVHDDAGNTAIHQNTKPNTSASSMQRAPWAGNMIPTCARQPTVNISEIKSVDSYVTRHRPSSCPSTAAYTNVLVFVSKSVSESACKHIRMHMYRKIINVSMYANVCTCLCVCICERTCICVHVNVYDVSQRKTGMA